MKKKLCSALLLTLSFIITGCTTIATTAGTSLYKVAVDERKVGTIASDTKITITILTKFINDDLVKAQDISIFCYEGNVYLVGEYELKEQKKRSLEITKGVEGVKSVSAYLSQKDPNSSCGTLDNLAITTKVKIKLLGDIDILSTNVDVETVNCTVVLLGIVGSEQELKKVIDHARKVTGIYGVKPFLKKAELH
ncbi:MAG TPA: BON domain-containing protein [Syntrophales bacterium]|nr:BON domain-containing protein [Syntrophales bacterium]